MDDSVIRSMAKWPHVPAVYGWLSLDREGFWRLKGARIKNTRSVAFINRHYTHDEKGRWYFQNGPQKVYLDLAYTPWIYSLAGEAGLQTHTGLIAGAPSEVWLDDEGNLLMQTNHGIGLFLDRDLLEVSDRLVEPGGETVQPDKLEAAIEGIARGNPPELAFSWNRRHIPIRGITVGEVPPRFGFMPNPAPDTVPTKKR